jgi:glycine/D-amino acid oxidase-like deaminating enzyme
LRIAATETELAEILAGIPVMREDGWPVQQVERMALPSRIQTAYVGGAYYPLDREIQPARFVAGLAWLAERAGAIIYEESPALAVELREHSVLIRTAAGSVTADTVLLAMNAWTPALAGQVGVKWPARAITPTRGQMLLTAPVAERIFVCPCSADEGYQYWRQLPDGRLVIGGWRNRSFDTEATMDETPTGAVQQHLETFVHDTLRLPDIPIERRWAGIMAFSPDGLPLVGRVPGTARAYIAAAYTGHGNAYALQASRVVTNLLHGRAQADADLFDPARLIGK